MLTYFPPWANDVGMYPSHALERHSAHCRALGLPDSTHPAEVSPLLTPEAIVAGDKAVAQLAEMEAWVPHDYDRKNTRRVKQDIIEGTQYRHIALLGGRGGSKSHDAGEAVIEKASLGQERVVACREFMASIKDSSKSLLVNKIKASRWANEWVITDRELKNTATGSLITFLGINRNPDSARSLEGATILLCEESENFSQESIDVLLPTIREGGSQIIWLWNPAAADSPVNQMFISGDLPERSFVRYVLSDNNRYFYRTEMPSERRTSFIKHTRAKFRHIWRGALDTNPDLAVYNNWQIGHVELPSDAVPMYGGDWGWVDPLAFLEFYVIEPNDPETERGKIYITAEVYGSGIPVKDLAGLLDEAMPMARNHTITADSSEPKSIDDLASKGFHVLPAKKGPGSIRAGIAFIQGYDIYVHPDCVNTIAEFGSYQWKQDRAGRIIRDPVDLDNHAMDGFRYGIEGYTPPPRNGGVVLI